MFSLLLFFLFLFPFDFLLVYFSGATFFWGLDFYNINFVFLTCAIPLSFFLAIPTPKDYILNYNFNFVQDKYIQYGLIFIYAVGTFSLSGGNIFESSRSYSAYQENIKGATGLNEYLILLSCIFVLFNKTKITRFVISLLLSFYIFKSVIYGFRVQALMQFVVLYFIVLNRDVKSKYLFVLLISGFFLMLLYGFAKEGMQFEQFGLDLLVDTRYGYAQSHQQGVLSASTVMLNYQEYVPNFFINIPSVLSVSTIPRGLIGDIFPWAYPSSFVQNFEYTPGGGLFTTQIYFLLGFPGLIIISFIMTLIIGKFIAFDKEKPSPIVAIFSIVALVFFPRWISYDFFNYYVRSSIVLVILYLLILLLLSVASKKNDR
ncbi:hypothetical protein [Aliivibrio fischeri]|uniref:hypothetical protein n=1 Tax=Aliivibrio fischeri TaxID=668 RepID=UPI00105E05F6|nr:hypothetical protein [Aliivibrio fischeri]TDM56051.1 hypothetical protein VFFQA001_01030 [Aliivibrio fischeri]